VKFLFDLGGVFFDWNPKYFYNNLFLYQDDLNFFLKHVCNDEWNTQQDSGRSIEEAINERIIKFPKYKNEIKLYYSNHRNMIRGIYQNSVNILSSLNEKNIPCFVLSNWSAETFVGMIDEYPFLKKFNGIMISGEEKIIKPQPEIFYRAIDKYQLIPSETVFIDDKLDNINASIKLGFKTIHLVDPKQIEKEIIKYLN